MYDTDTERERQGEKRGENIGPRLLVFPRPRALQREKKYEVTTQQMEEKAEEVFSCTTSALASRQAA